MHAIDHYTQNILKKELQAEGVRIKAIKKVIRDIDNRLKSLVSHWNDQEFRNVILLLGKEEALHYEPLHADLEIKSFVVVGMRNSLFEDIQNNELAAKFLGVKGALPKDLDVKKFTESAIRYFSDVNMEELAPVTTPADHDVFGHLADSYPVAWDMIKRVSELKDGEELEFTPIECDPIPLESLVDEPINTEGLDLYKLEIESAVIPKISPQLYLTLQQGNFYVDSFKALSRNTEVVFKVLEYVIRSKSIFVTNNVLLYNGFISSRDGWIRPMHMASDHHSNVSNTKGLKGVHKKFIENMFHQQKIAQ